jgi:hypothetical protein
MTSTRYQVRRMIWSLRNVSYLPKRLTVEDLDKRIVEARARQACFRKWWPYRNMKHAGVPA